MPVRASSPVRQRSRSSSPKPPKPLSSKPNTPSASLHRAPTAVFSPLNQYQGSTTPPAPPATRIIAEGGWPPGSWTGPKFGVLESSQSMGGDFHRTTNDVHSPHAALLPAFAALQLQQQSPTQPPPHPPPTPPPRQPPTQQNEQRLQRAIVPTTTTKRVRTQPIPEVPGTATAHSLPTYTPSGRMDLALAATAIEACLSDCRTVMEDLQWLDEVDIISDLADLDEVDGLSNPSRQDQHDYALAGDSIQRVFKSVVEYSELTSARNAAYEDEEAHLLRSIDEVLKAIEQTEDHNHRLRVSLLGRRGVKRDHRIDELSELSSC